MQHLELVDAPGEARRGHLGRDRGEGRDEKLNSEEAKAVMILALLAFHFCRDVCQ